MTELELRKKAADIKAQFWKEEVSDEEILRQIREEPELIQVECLSGANLFLEAVCQGRFSVAQALAGMGADLNMWRRFSTRPSTWYP